MPKQYPPNKPRGKPTDYRIEGDIAFISIKRRGGEFLEIIVDAELVDSLCIHKWCVGSGYVRRGQKLPNGGYKNIYIHRQIMNAPDDMTVDHINGDKLDNRRSNLRICTYLLLK